MRANNLIISSLSLEGVDVTRSIPVLFLNIATPEAVEEHFLYKLLL